MAGRWYNSETGVGVSGGLIVLLLGVIGFGTYLYLERNSEAVKARESFKISIEERDLNGDGKLERYIEFNGQKYFSTVDGKSLEENLGK